jgi:lantibiotic modifying enzyme
VPALVTLKQKNDIFAEAGKMKITVVFLLLTVVFAPGTAAGCNDGESLYLDKALRAAEWIKSSAVKTPDGTVWPGVPGVPGDPKPISSDLYAGTPGVVLFFLEAYYSTGSKRYLEDARGGADHLLASISGEKNMGLYTGIAGTGFALEETFRAAGKKKYRDGVLQCIRLIRSSAENKGKGIQWDKYTDIIGGCAGTGLFLLYIAQKLEDPGLYDLAARAGTRLLELGIAEKNGLKWFMSPDYPKLMPNFSHGTAGIAYFLATLYKHTKKKEFLAGALAGANYLLAIAGTGGNTCLIFHHEPGGEDLYYLGWCHGPVGTARLFYRLYEVTGDKTWLEWVKKSAHAILESGIPGKQTPGYWNNVGRCCGAAGAAEFFLDLYRVTENKDYLAFSKKVTNHILEKAAPAGKGLKWIQAEHRVKPGLLLAQTGLMQGAAGIGMWLLKLHAFEKGKKEKIAFPDSPF